MFQDFGASPLNFTIAKATGFQSAFSAARKPVLKAKTSVRITAVRMKRCDFISSVAARFRTGCEICWPGDQSSRDVTSFRVYGMNGRKSTVRRSESRGDEIGGFSGGANGDKSEQI